MRSIAPSLPGLQTPTPPGIRVVGLGDPTQPPESASDGVYRAGHGALEQDLRIRLRWLRYRSPVALFFVGLFGLFLCALADGPPTSLLVGGLVVSSYFAMAFLRNVTTIAVASDALVVRHGPLPVPFSDAGVQLPIDRVKAFEVRWGRRQRRGMRYEVVAILDDDRPCMLLSSEYDDTADFLVEVLRAHRAQSLAAREALVA